MMVILYSLNAHIFPIFQPILMILVSKLMVHRVLSDKSYLLLGLLSPFKPLTEHHLEFQSLKGGCRGSSESTLVKMSNCWKSHAAAQISMVTLNRRCITVPYMYYGPDSSCLFQIFVSYPHDPFDQF